MDKANRWISEHKIIVFVLYNLVCWVLFLLLSSIVEMRLTWWVVLGVFILFISVMFVNSTDIQTLNNAIKSYYEQCDPTPFLETVERQLLRVKSKPYRQMLSIDKAVALRDLGQFDEVFSILSGINIDQYNRTSPLIKIVYYNNLTDIFILKGDFVRANIWHTKVMQMINGLKGNKKQKKQLNETSILNQAELLIADNNFSEAENLISGLPESASNRQKISKCLLYRQIANETKQIG